MYSTGVSGSHKQEKHCTTDYVSRMSYRSFHGLASTGQESPVVMGIPAGTQGPQRQVGDGKAKTLILVEDADVLTDEDRGFLPSLAALCSSTKV